MAETGFTVERNPDTVLAPDIAFVRRSRIAKLGEGYWEGAPDLAVEVVSGSKADRRRDWFTKRKEYAASGVAEYWIVDPDQGRICVLTRKGGKYETHGDYRAGDQATSKLLRGLSFDVDEIFAAVRKK